VSLWLISEDAWRPIRVLRCSRWVRGRMECHCRSPSFLLLAALQRIPVELYDARCRRRWGRFNVLVRHFSWLAQPLLIGSILQTRLRIRAFE